MPDEQHSRKQSIPEECSGYPVPVEQYREQGRRHTQYVIISWYNFQHLLHFVMVIRVFVFSGTAWRSITIKGDITRSPRSLKLRAREKISWEVSQVKQDRIVQTEKSIKWQSLCGKLEMICGFRNPPFWMYVFHKLSMWKCCLAYIVINYCVFQVFIILKFSSCIIILRNYIWELMTQRSLFITHSCCYFTRTGPKSRDPEEKRDSDSDLLQEAGSASETQVGFERSFHIKR